MTTIVRNTIELEDQHTSGGYSKRLLTGRTGIVAATRGFHGRTLGALGLTWNQHYREPFVGWTPEHITHIVYNDLASAEAAITDQTAAVVIEAVQGESGVYTADPE